MTLAVFVFLLFEFRISRPELVVRNIGIDFFKVLIIGFIGRASIGGHNARVRQNILTDTHTLITTLYSVQYRL